MDEHDQVLLRVFKRLIQFADGRTIVVPLSGGYDSRLIVLMLKRLKYDKVITFSYGRPGNKESKVSSKIAKSLGLQWEFVEYSNELWYKWYHSDEYSRYAQFANGLTSVPHIQDWPAVWQLKKKNLIPNDSIFVAGHTPMLSLVGKPTLENSTANAILKKHYSLWSIDPKLKQLINERIRNNLNNQLDCSIEDIHGFYLWECTERQSKFIANAVRVYEFWEYNWYL